MNKKQRKFEIRLKRHKVHENAKKLTEEQLEWQIDLDNDLKAYHGIDVEEDETKTKKRKED